MGVEMLPKGLCGGGQRSLRWYGGVALLASTAAVLGLWGAGACKGGLPAVRLLGSLAGVAPLVVHRFGEKSAHLHQWQRLFLLATIPTLSAACAALPWLFPRFYREHLTPTSPPFDVLGVVSMACIVPVAMACVWVKPPPSVYIRDAVRCVLSYWLIIVLWMLYAVVVAPLASGPSPSFLAAAFLDFYRNFVLHFEGVVVFFWTAWMMVRRFQALAPGQSIAARHASVLIGLMASAFQAAAGVLTLSGLGQRNPERTTLYLFFITVFVGVWVFYTSLLARTLWQSLLLVRAEMLTVTGAPRAEAAWACRVLTLELAATLTLGVTTPFTWCTLAVQDVVIKAYHITRVPGLILGASVVHRVDLVFNAATIAVLSGLLGQVGKPQLGVDAAARDVEEGAKPTRQNTLFSGCTDVSDSTDDWRSKVEELSCRGVRLEDLLAFWTRLLQEPGLMPGFSPHRSTTNDVVRRVVIPMSRDPSGPGGRALASVWSQGEPRRADCMVTHNWSNLFWHLVAAIVADCLGEDCYDRVAARLLTEGGAAGLGEALVARGTIGRTCWVCAFSVNQHAGICNGFGLPPLDPAQYAEWDSKRRDTVSREVLPVCSCEQPKILNSDPALCEMNKFADMMRKLTKRVEGFCHLVVVDAQFEVFHRAWCVAEIVESGISGIPQRIMIHSQEVLDRHYLSLSTLDVRECQSTRPEDRDMILAGITDIDRFNCELQWAIFGTKGLFQKWADGQERSALIGRIIRRARSSAAASQSQSSSSSSKSQKLPARRSSSWLTWLSGRTRTPSQSLQLSGDVKEAAVAPKGGAEAAAPATVLQALYPPPAAACRPHPICGPNPIGELKVQESRLAENAEPDASIMASEV